MKRLNKISLWFVLLIVFASFKSNNFEFRKLSYNSFSQGESIEFRVHYGIVTAGYGSIKVLPYTEKIKGRDVQVNHVWADAKNRDTYTALWNLCVTPAFLAKTTDGSNHPEVIEALKYRSVELFGHVPNGLATQID